MEDDRTTLEIIEKCLKDDFDIDFLQSKASKLNVDRFSEIAEELAANKRCGYLMCKNVLTPAEHAKSQQKFKIRYNRIFNVSQRRLFCSDECYALYCEAKNQFEESPNPKKSIIFPNPQKENQGNHGGHVTGARDSAKSGIIPGEEVDLRGTADIINALQDLSILDRRTEETAPPDGSDKHGNSRIPDESWLSEEDKEQKAESRDIQPIDESSRDSDSYHDRENFMDSSAPKEPPSASQNRKKPTNREEALGEIRRKYFEKSGKGLKLKKPAAKLINPLPLKPLEPLKPLKPLEPLVRVTVSINE